MKGCRVGGDWCLNWYDAYMILRAGMRNAQLIAGTGIQGEHNIIIIHALCMIIFIISTYIIIINTYFIYVCAWCGAKL